MQSLEFQVQFAKVVDCVGNTQRRFHDDFGKTRGRRCTVLLKGRTIEGKSVLLRVKGFRPWFYVLDDDPYANDPPQLNGTGPDKGRYFLKELGVDLSMWNCKYDINYQVERRRLVDGCEPNPADGGATIMRRLVYRILSPTMKARKNAIDILKRKYLAEDDNQCSALVQFYSLTRIRPISWVRVDMTKTKRYPSGTLTWCADYELRTEIENIQAIEGRVLMAPFRVVVMDIETEGFDPNIHKVLIIGTRQKILNTENTEEKGIEFCLDKASPDPQNRFDLRCYENEASLFCGYGNYIKKEFDADAIITWNGRGFDNNFNAVRASKCSPTVQEQFFQFSFLKDDTCKSVKKKAANRSNRTSGKVICGRICLGDWIWI